MGGLPQKMNILPNLSLAPRLVSVAEMQAIEKASDARGHSFAAMMERAGRAVAETILARYGTQSILVLVGPGNNGGDGLVCARHLQEAGAPVCVYLWKRVQETGSGPDEHWARLLMLGVPMQRAEEDSGFVMLQEWLGQSAIVVDALLGTGAARPIEGLLADLLAAAAATASTQKQTVVAVDCASGLNCDTGALSPHALAPQLTVTFGFAKLGHYQFPGAGAVGDLVVADIGLPADLAAALPTFLITPELVREWLPKRPRVSHKGTFGKVLLAVGSESYPGAAYLSSAAAARAGAGLVTGAVPRSIWSLVAARLPEPTWLLLPVQSSGPLAGQLEPSAGATLAAGALDYDALVLGCGLGNNKATRRFVDQLLRHPLPATLIDADGLNCLAGLQDWPARLPAQCVLTPHPAEMARLCGSEVGEVVAKRWTLAREQAAVWRCTLLVKGPYTVVAEPEGRLAVLPVATAALATAGSGDILSGIIGSLLAQGLDPFTAACCGAWLHGAAGLRCEQEIGVAGVIASDLLARLPAVLRTLHQPDTAPAGH